MTATEQVLRQKADNDPQGHFRPEGKREQNWVGKNSYAIYPVRGRANTFAFTNRIIRVWLTCECPDKGPHQHDTANGYIYRLIGLTNTGNLIRCGRSFEPRIASIDKESWSWGNWGLKTSTALQAQKICEEAFAGTGIDFAGFVG